MAVVLPANAVVKHYIGAFQLTEARIVQSESCPSQLLQCVISISPAVGWGPERLAAQKCFSERLGLLPQCPLQAVSLWPLQPPQTPGLLAMGPL